MGHQLRKSQILSHDTTVSDPGRGGRMSVKTCGEPSDLGGVAREGENTPKRRVSRFRRGRSSTNGLPRPGPRGEELCVAAAEPSAAAVHAGST